MGSGRGLTAVTLCGCRCLKPSGKTRFCRKWVQTCLNNLAQGATAGNFLFK